MSTETTPADDAATIEPENVYTESAPEGESPDNFHAESARKEVSPDNIYTDSAPEGESPDNFHTESAPEG